MWRPPAPACCAHHGRRLRACHAPAALCAAAPWPWVGPRALSQPAHFLLALLHFPHASPRAQADAGEVMPGFEDEALLREREHRLVSLVLKTLLVREGQGSATSPVDSP